MLYCNGKLGEANYSEGIKWYLKAAEQGDTFSQCTIGEFYAEGKVVQQNYYEAVKWYEKAARQGSGWGKKQLAYCYRNGTGVQQNMQKYFNLLKEAVDEERKSTDFIFTQDCDAVAFRELGKCYFWGIGTNNNSYEAHELFQVAAKNNDAQAKVMKACFEKIKGFIRIDEARAIQWLKSEAAQGNQVAEELLDELSFD